MIAFVTGAITVAVPLLLAGLGEQVSERAGVLNLGLEGMMLVGAFVGFAVTLATGSFASDFWLGRSAASSLPQSWASCAWCSISTRL